MSEEVAANLRLWNGWAELHMSGTDYDVEGFIADPASRSQCGSLCVRSRYARDDTIARGGRRGIPL